MPSIVTIIPRKIFLEDLHISTSNAPATVDQEVAGVGTVPLTPISVMLYSDLHPYADDSAAAAGGIGVGYMYWNSTTSLPKTRMS